MTGKFIRPVHSKRGLASKRREWEATGSAKSVSQIRKVLTGSVPVFAMAFCAALVASSIFVPTKSSDATNRVTANITAGGYYVKINSSDVVLDLLSTPTGSMTVASSTVKTTTNSPSGYKLYLGMSDTKSDGSQKSAADKAKTGLYLNENLSSSDVVPATSGTSAAPAALTNSTWGYAVDKNTTGVPAIWTGKNHSAMTSGTPDDTQLFAGVPAVGSEDLLQSTSTANTNLTEDEWQDSYWSDSTKYTAATVWYGVRANMSVASGSYSNTIAYTAIAQTGPSGGTLTFSPATYDRGARYDEKTWNDTLTITTSLLTSTSMDLGTATVTLSGGPYNGNYTCTNPVATVVPLESGANSGYATITCTLPQAYAGDYQVVVNIPKFGVTYTTPNDAPYKYVVTWDSISAMQEMTPAVCNSANGGVAVTTSTYPVPELYLSDLRGGGGHISGSVTTGYSYSPTQTGKYRIRKLADGNCWMTENMELQLSTSQTFHSYDSNVEEDWSPKYNPTTTTGSGVVDSNRTHDHSYTGNGSAGTSTEDTLASTYVGHSIAAETQGIGTYYNWAAAIASNTDYTTAGDSVSTSICPKGWTLPKGDASTTKSFQALANAYVTSTTGAAPTFRSYPLSFVLSGGFFWGNGSLGSQGAYGYWWSSTVDSETYSRGLGMNTSSIYPQNNGNKLYGFAVRCVSL